MSVLVADYVSLDPYHGVGRRGEAEYRWEYRRDVEQIGIIWRVGEEKRGDLQ